MMILYFVTISKKHIKKWIFFSSFRNIGSHPQIADGNMFLLCHLLNATTDALQTVPTIVFTTTTEHVAGCSSVLLQKKMNFIFNNQVGTSV